MIERSSVRVRHRLGRMRAHAAATHDVACALVVTGVDGGVRFDDGAVHGLGELIDDFERRPEGIARVRTHAETDPRAGQAIAVLFIGQRHAIVGIRQQLRRQTEAQLAGDRVEQGSAQRLAEETLLHG